MGIDIRIRACAVSLLALAMSCSDDAVDRSEKAAQPLGGGQPAVGLALEIDNGAGVPISVQKGRLYYVNQLDMRAAIEATVDEGVAGLDAAGDFKDLSWNGVSLEDEEPLLLPNPDGTFVRRRFFRNAEWMNDQSFFVVVQVDASGQLTWIPSILFSGRDDRRHVTDSFFGRRFRAIQWVNDCATPSNCAGATRFQEEALVELRYAHHPGLAFPLMPNTTALKVYWSKRPAPYTIPVTQVETPPYAYGFGIDVEPITPPGPDGTYAQGSQVTFRLTLKDGAGNRLHPVGSLPTYNEAIFGPNPAGIQYYRAFFDPTTTYYRRKHKERMLMADFIGPAQSTQPGRSIVEIPAFFGPEDVQTVATVPVDGFYSQFRTFPAANDLFGGAFDPSHAAWGNPVPDTWTHQIPADAPPGTYYLSIKGRRTYMGEDVPASKTISIQVGTPTPTTPVFGTGPCNTCHSGESSLGKILHANDQRQTCAGCHVPLAFELEGPIYVRTHFIHSRSRRFDAPLDKCSSCHLNQQSIQRTSQSACLSCHKSYPADHVQQFGPIESMYVGGGRDSFQQCSSSCHTNHPGSGL
jgi:predicted CXXCH cytochrome family protein